MNRFTFKKNVRHTGTQMTEINGKNIVAILNFHQLTDSIK